MKSILFFIALFPSLFCFSQTYHFDYMVKKSIFNAMQQDEKTYFSFHCIGSETALFLDKTSKRMIGILYDSRTKYRNVFNVEVKDDKFQFSYLYTNDLNDKVNRNTNKNPEFEIIKKNNEVYRINVYENSRRKKIDFTLDIVLQKSDYAYKKIYLDYFGSEKINEAFRNIVGENYAIKECTVLYGTNRNKVITKIEDITPANFSINLPQKLIFRDFDYWKEKNE